MLVKDVATVALGPEIRRGVADLDGEGDVVGGIVVMRQGENALNVIERVKAKLEELKPSLPEGRRGRHDLRPLGAHRAGHRHAEAQAGRGDHHRLPRHPRLPLAHPVRDRPDRHHPGVGALSFIPMYLMGLTANIMSLAGIAISIGVLVDGAIVEVENAYNKIHHWMKDGKKGDFHQVRLEALEEVGPSVFFSLLVIAVAFMPVFTLVDQEGPALPAARLLEEPRDGDRGGPGHHARPGDADAVRAHGRVQLPAPLARVARDHRVLVGKLLLGGGAPDQPLLLHRLRAALPLRAAPPEGDDRRARAARPHHDPRVPALGSEFMPPLNEGTILYMPSAVEPGMSVAEARRRCRSRTSSS